MHFLVEADLWAGAAYGLGIVLGLHAEEEGAKAEGEEELLHENVRFGGFRTAKVGGG
jgi:hypothetical protein